MKNKNNEIENKLKAFDNLNQSKWMRYEDDIVKYYYKQLKEWLDNGMIKPSVTAFTSGLGRDIARLMEESKKQGTQSNQKNVLKIIGDRIKYLQYAKEGKKLTGVTKHYWKSQSKRDITILDLKIKELEELKKRLEQK